MRGAGFLDRERMLRIDDNTVAQIRDDLSTYKDKLPAIAPEDVREASLGDNSRAAVQCLRAASRLARVTRLTRGN